MRLLYLLFLPISIFAGEALPKPKPLKTGYPQYQTGQVCLAQGWHDRMHEKGVDISSSYYVEFAGNPVGGQEHGFGNAASWNTGLGLDFDRIVGIPGLSLYTSCCFRSGVNLSARKINNQYEVTELYGGETIRLTELYLEETLLNGDFHIKAGS